MKNRTIGILGLTLVILGVCGTLVAGGLLVASVADDDRWFDDGSGRQDSRGSRDGWNFGQPDSYDSLGQRIYFTGEDADGNRIPRDGGWGMMASGGCVTCHGSNGTGGAFGGMMGGRLNIPDIRYETLTSPHEEEGSTEDAWTDEDIATAIRTGEEPSGDQLSRYMPRWDMSDEDVRAVIAYLKELD
jgi:hypothetical protein